MAWSDRNSQVLRLEGDHLFLSFNGGKLRSDLTIKRGYELGTVHEVIFEVRDDLHYCYYSEDGNLKDAFETGTASDYLIRDGANDFVMDKEYGEAYFKIGNYTQSNAEKEGASTDDPENYGEVYVYDFYVDHQLEPVALKSVEFASSNVNVVVGSEQKLGVVFVPDNASNLDVSYTSSAEDIVSVDDNGVIRALKAGSATIKLVSVDGGFEDECTVVVSEPSSNPNVAVGKSVTATGTADGSNTPDKLVDGDSDSRWAVSGFPQSAVIDLGSQMEIDGMELVCYKDRAYQYTIALSTDGVDYSEVVDRSSNSKQGTNDSPITDSFTSRTARYVKITVSGANEYTGDWISLEELRVLGR